MSQNVSQKKLKPEDLSAEDMRQSEIILDTKKKRRSFAIYAAVLVVVLTVGYIFAVPG